jgi:hypothetical protein
MFFDRYSLQTAAMTVGEYGAHTIDFYAYHSRLGYKNGLLHNMVFLKNSICNFLIFKKVEFEKPSILAIIQQTPKKKSCDL